MIHCSRGPWIRTFHPLPHMRSYIHSNHCQNNFSFVFKTFMENESYPLMPVKYHLYLGAIMSEKWVRFCSTVTTKSINMLVAYFSWHFNEA